MLCGELQLGLRPPCAVSAERCVPRGASLFIYLFIDQGPWPHLAEQVQHSSLWERTIYVCVCVYV